MKINKLFVLIGIILFSLLFINLYKDFIKDNSYNKEVSSINGYDYTLNSSDTKVYKDKFNELNNILSSTSINNKEYAKKIAELFLIDVFTLDNKITSTDIGGLEFIHNDLKEDFKMNMGLTLYKNIESNLDGKRNQKLPAVKNVIVDNLFETKYIYNGKEYDSYLVNASIEYEKDMDYQNKIKLTLINDNNKIYVVKGE